MLGGEGSVLSSLVRFFLRNPRVGIKHGLSSRQASVVRDRLIGPSTTAGVGCGGGRDRGRRLRGKDCTPQSIGRPISKCSQSCRVQCTAVLALHDEKASTADHGRDGERKKEQYGVENIRLSPWNPRERGYARDPGAWEPAALFQWSRRRGREGIEAPQWGSRLRNTCDRASKHELLPMARSLDRNKERENHTIV